jgi:hypothetical protein
MGLKSSPYQCTQAMAIAEEVIQRDRMDPANMFRWDYVRFNLPGSPNYDPSVPWVSKVRTEDGQIAADLFTFVDDLRPTGSSKKEAWQAARKVTSTLSYLGIQDASRKQRDSSQSPGAWAEAVIHAGLDGVFLLTSEEKWVKAKVLLQEVLDLLAKGPENLPSKRLEQIRGFLVYITWTYVGMGMARYMIGFHMLIALTRDGEVKIERVGAARTRCTG